MFDEKCGDINIPRSCYFMKHSLSSFVCTVDICSIVQKRFNEIEIKCVLGTIWVGQCRQIMYQSMISNILSFSSFHHFPITKFTLQHSVHWFICSTGTYTGCPQKSHLYRYSLLLLISVYCTSGNLNWLLANNNKSACCYKYFCVHEPFNSILKGITTHI